MKKQKKAEQLGYMNEFAVHERRKLLAQAYLLNPKDYVPGESYQMIEGDSSFQISYLNGYFAWGYRDNTSSLEAVPISMLRLNESRRR